MLEPGQQVYAPHPLILLGLHIGAAQQGKIISRWRDVDGSWLYRVVWEPDAVVLTAREGEIEAVKED